MNDYLYYFPNNLVLLSTILNLKTNCFIKKRRGNLYFKKPGRKFEKNLLKTSGHHVYV